MKNEEPQPETIRYEIPRWLADTFNENEQLLWVGRPLSQIHFRHADAFSLWTIVIGFFASYMAFIAMKDYFLGTIMLCYATFHLFGRHRYDAKKRATTWYALTDQRALIGTNFFVPGKVHSYPKGEWTLLELVEEKDCHTIWFTSKSGFWHGINSNIRHGFMLISDGSRVFELMENVRGSRQ